MAYVLKNLSNVEPSIRACIVDEAVNRSVTLSDVIAEKLAREWDMPYALSGSQAVGLEPDEYVTQINLRIPQDMAMRIWMVGRTRSQTESSVVQEILARHYGVPYEPVKRGGASRRRRLRTEEAAA